MGTLFGTDGIRGVANQHPITCEVALKTGRAMGLFIQKNGYSTVVIGKDTRISGDMLESALAAGIASAGSDVLLAGVIPTPGVAYLCSDIDMVGAGIVISASHNPYEDNGIKIFKRGGIKLSDKEEENIENYILSEPENLPAGQVGKISSIENGLQRYTQFLLNKFPDIGKGENLKLVIDCSNGAASKMARLVFNKELFDPVFIYDAPNGKNINDNCGSQHTEDLAKLVLNKKANAGLAFDGDADRLIAIDEKGNQITGDQILAVCAKFAKDQKRLNKSILVSTIMSNVGLTQALDGLDIVHVKAGVGDRKVLEEMKKCGAVIGGEDSGHMIFLDEHSTGDGMLSALKLIEVMVSTHEKLSDLANVMTVFPQVLMNVEIDESRPDFMENTIVADTIKVVEDRLRGQGRVLIRYSGTQPLLRVMVEGPEQKMVESCCAEICESIEKHL